LGIFTSSFGDTTSANLYYHKVLTHEGMGSSPYQTLAEEKLGLAEVAEKQ
jgi:hypothetical protein